jgi:hypothetical protein
VAQDKSLEILLEAQGRGKAKTKKVDKSLEILKAAQAASAPEPSVLSQVVGGVSRVWRMTPMGQAVQGVVDAGRLSDKIGGAAQGAIKGLVNTPVQGTPQQRFGQLVEGVKQEAVKGYTTPKADVVTSIAKPKSKAGKIVSRVGDVAVAGAVDPVSLIVGGPTGKIATDIGKGALKAVARTRPIKAIQTNLLDPTADWITKRMAESTPGSYLTRYAGWLGLGPNNILRKVVESPYNRNVENATRVVREGVLQPIADLTKQHRTTKPARQVLDDYAASNNGANPFAEYVRWRAEDLMDDALTVHGRTKALEMPAESVAKLQGKQIRNRQAELHNAVRETGVDPNVIEQSAQRLVHAFGELENAVSKVAPKRITDEGRKQRFKDFTEGVLGEAPNPKKYADWKAQQPKNIKLVHEAAVRNLVNGLENSPWMRQIAGDRPTPGWKHIGDIGGFGGKRGYEVPAPLHALLEVESARGGFGLKTGEAQTDYIKSFDAWLAIQKNVFGGVKRIMIGNPLTQAANLMSNNIVTKLGLRRNGINSSTADLLAEVVKAGNDIRLWRRHGKQFKDIDEFRLHSNGVDTSIIDAALQGSVGGKGVGKKLGMLYPVNWFVDFQGYSEQTYKLAMYRMLSKKLDPKSAAAQVDKYLFDYSDRGPWLEIADRYGIWPFNSYPTKAAELLFDTIINAPHELVKYPRLMHLANLGYNTENKKDLAGRQRNPFLIPYGDTNNPDYIDVQRFLPMGAGMEAIAEAGNKNPANSLMAAMGLGRAGAEGIEAGLNAPLPMRAMLTEFGLSPLSESEKVQGLLSPGQPPSELRGIKNKEHLRNYAPFGRTALAGMEAARGQGISDFAEPRTVEDVLLQYGMGLRTISPQRKEDTGAKTGLRRSVNSSVVAPVFGQEMASAQAGNINSRIREDVAKLTVDQARAKLTFEIGRYIKQIHGSNQIVAKGKLAPGGLERIRNAAQYLVALQQRAISR